MEERQDIILSISTVGSAKAQNELRQLAKTANATVNDISNAFSRIRNGFDFSHGIHGVQKRSSKYYDAIPLTSGDSVIQRSIDPSRGFITTLNALGSGNATGVHRLNQMEDFKNRLTRIAEFFQMIQDRSNGIFNINGKKFSPFKNENVPLLEYDNGGEFWLNALNRQRDLKEKYENLSPEKKEYLKQRSLLGPKKPTFASDKKSSGGGGALGSAMSFLGGISSKAVPLISALWLMNKAISAITKTFERFKVVAEDWFIMFKQSLTGGLSTGNSAFSLNKQQKLIQMFGGDAASASAFNASISNARAMLGYGGNGGALMEAARLFGVNITGSGKYGFATNEEFLHNIAKRMGVLDKDSKLALANTVGLSPEMFWATKDGSEMFDKRMNYAQTYYDKFAGDSILGLHDDETRRITESFTIEWERFLISIKEFIRVLSVVVLPIITFVCKSLSWVFQLISTAFGPFLKMAGIGFNRLVSNNEILSSADIAENIARSAHDEYVRSADKYETGGNRSININNVNISTSDNLTNDNAERFGRGIGDNIMSEINTYTRTGMGSSMEYK